MNPDRRPIAVHAFQVGNYVGNNRGWPPDLVSGGIAAYIGPREAGWDALGITRIMWHMPSGIPQGQPLVSSASWFTVPQAWRDWLISTKAARVASGVEHGIYQGVHAMPALDPANLYDDTQVGHAAEIMDATNSGVQQYIRNTTLKWVDAGFTWACYDAATGDEPRFNALSDFIIAGGMGMGMMEAVPCYFDGKEYLIDETQITKYPTCCLSYFRDLVDPDHKWRFDPATTEAHLFILYNTPYSVEALQEDLAAGWIVGMWDGHWWYDPEISRAIVESQTRRKGSAPFRRRRAQFHP